MILRHTRVVVVKYIVVCIVHCIPSGETKRTDRLHVCTSKYLSAHISERGKDSDRYVLYVCLAPCCGYIAGIINVGKIFPTSDGQHIFLEKVEV